MSWGDKGSARSYLRVLESTPTLPAVTLPTNPSNTPEGQISQQWVVRHDYTGAVGFYVGFEEQL